MSKLACLRATLQALENAEDETAKTLRQFKGYSIEHDRIHQANHEIGDAIKLVKAVLEHVESDTYTNMMKTTYAEPQ